MRRRTAKLERRARLVTPDTLVGIDPARALGGGHSYCGSFRAPRPFARRGGLPWVAGIVWMSGIILASVTSIQSLNDWAENAVLWFPFLLVGAGNGFVVGAGGGGRSGRTSRAAAGLAGPPP